VTEANSDFKTFLTDRISPLFNSGALTPARNDASGGADAESTTCSPSAHAGAIARRPTESSVQHARALSSSNFRTGGHVAHARAVSVVRSPTFNRMAGWSTDFSPRFLPRAERFITRSMVPTRACPAEAFRRRRWYGRPVPSPLRRISACLRGSAPLAANGRRCRNHVSCSRRVALPPREICW
jgi:hypothetical protein